MRTIFRHADLEVPDFILLPPSRETPSQPFGLPELAARGPGLGEGVEDGDDLPKIDAKRKMELPRFRAQVTS